MNFIPPPIEGIVRRDQWHIEFYSHAERHNSRSERRSHALVGPGSNDRYLVEYLFEDGVHGMTRKRLLVSIVSILEIATAPMPCTAYEYLRYYQGQAGNGYSEIKIRVHRGNAPDANA